MTVTHVRETTAARTVRGEIAARVREMRASGRGIRPPLLLLGTMERVGSNLVSDTLRPVTGQHNEPFRQQLGPAHPLSALNPGLSPDDPLERLGHYGRHWLVTFAAGKHAAERQVIKETNLYFALPALLGLFPDSPVAVLTRSSLGVASSFARGDLFRRWDYRARYRQMTAMTTRPEYAGQVSDAAARALSAGREAVPGPTWDLARDWGGGDHLYSLAPPAGRRLPGRIVLASRLSCPVRWVPGHSGCGLRWRNLLVTNDEFAAFLNEMAAAGLPNCMDGCYVLAVEMPRERGGRLHYNRYDGRWTASTGFGHHPASWVTWAGAATCAARHGARLPARAELLAETSRDTLTVTNCAYQAGDTSPATEPGRSCDEVHHLAGNLQVWCGDGPNATPETPASRWLHGAAWNTPGTPEEIRRPRARHLLGTSRGVGIRLVRDVHHSPVRAEELAELLTSWVRSLSRRDRSLCDLDEALRRALAALQSDG